MTKPLIAITGATSGIGLQTAKRFSEAGYPTLLMGRNTETAEALKLNNSMTVKVDVTDKTSIETAIQAAEQKFGPVDCLINNAGIMLLGDMCDQNPNEWQTMVNVNVLGVMNGMQSVMGAMKQRQHGSIINVSSIAGKKPFPNHAAYVATKFAVHGMTDNVREELSPYNVRVMTIAPGAVDTPLLSHTTSQQIKDDYAEWKKEMGGVLTADDIARTIVFAYEQPQSVNLREIVLATTKQTA